MIRIDNLQFAYDQRQVLFDVSLTLEKHSITGLIGENGAGKSTLMRCIAGLLVPDGGAVYLDGVPILDNPQYSYTQLGYLPDIFGLSESLTLLQHWTYSAHAKGVVSADIASAIAETAELLGLNDKLHHKISELSRGQRQRVGIGQVIIHKPKLLILDEPASGLDPKARHELSVLFKRLQAAGVTLLVSSHILSELDEYCTHMLVLEAGRVVRHQALNASLSSEACVAQIPLQLSFSEMTDTLKAVVGAMPALDAPQFDDVRAVVIAKVNGDHVTRTAVIAELIHAGLPLIGVEVLKESLWHSYQGLHADTSTANTRNVSSGTANSNNSDTNTSTSAQGASHD